jgi:hypothetical protein
MARIHLRKKKFKVEIKETRTGEFQQKKQVTNDPRGIVVSSRLMLCTECEDLVVPYDLVFCPEVAD